MSDLELQHRLERDIEGFEGEPGDWEGVLAGVRTARRRTRLVRLAALTAALAVLVVTPAFGIGERLLHAIAGEPAPEDVKSELRQLNEVPEPVLELLDDLNPGVIADRARGVMSVQTTRGRVNLWVAPTKDGGFCAYVETETGGSSACGNDADFGLARPGLSADVRPLDARNGTDNRLAFGRIIGWKPGDRVELELGDGRRLAARVADGWLMREFPEGAALVRIHLLRASAVVATQEMLPSTPPPAMPTPEQYRELLAVETLTGDTAVLSVAPAPPGQECYRVTTASTEAGTCGDLPVGDIAVSGDLASALLFGPVQVPAASLEVVFEDGEQDDVPFKEGYFLYAVPAEHVKRGHLPKEFVARDGAGNVVARGPAKPGVSGG
jgi:hypothetical protein